MLLVEHRGRVAVLTLNRPERRNALGTESMSALSDALSMADRDDAIGAIVLTGAAPAFCAGSDLKELGGLSIQAMCDHESETATIARSIGQLEKPVIAAVEGYALGGGFILAVSCDLVVSATNARWHLPEVANGWLPPWGLQALVARVGPVRARTLTWGAAPVDGTAGFRIGLVDALADPGHALNVAIDYATALAALPIDAVRTTKEFYSRMIGDQAEALDAQASQAFAVNCATPAAVATLSRFTVKA